MKSHTEAYPEPDTPFDAFKELARKIVSVPKKEADEKEKEYQRKKQADKKTPK
jgi:hypothetical protein